MPFAPKPFSQLDEEKKNQQQQGGINISGGAGANFSTGIPGQEASNGAKPQKSSGNYANIQSYLDANKTQADSMGQNIAGNVDKSADEAQKSIQTFDTKAPKVEAYDPNEIFNNVTNLSDDQKNQYRTQRSTGGYTGPQSIDQVEGYADTQKKATEANTKLKNAGSEYGQQQLLKDTYGRPQYSAGENRLDQVLLQNSDGSKQALEGVKSKYQDLENLFSNSATNVGNSINQANQQALANKQNLLKAEQDQFNNLINPIQQRADQANIDNPALVGRVQEDLLDDTLNAETMALLGLNEGQQLFNLDLKGYLKPGLTQVGLNNVANADERAKYKALADLIQDPTKTQLTEQAENVDPLGFDKTQFDKDYSARKSEYEKAYNTDRSIMNGMTAKEAEAMKNDLETKNSLGYTPTFRNIMLSDLTKALEEWNRVNLNSRTVKKG